MSSPLCLAASLFPRAACVGALYAQARGVALGSQEHKGTMPPKPKGKTAARRKRNAKLASPRKQPEPAPEPEPALAN